MSKLSDYVNISQDGQAFVQFETSLEDDNVVSGYVPVKSTLDVMEFLNNAISGNTAQSRAVICWGNYGTGKSRLCTVIARLFQEGYESPVLKPVWERLIARGESDSLNRLKQEMMPAGRDWVPWLVVPIYAGGNAGTINAALNHSLMKALKRVGLNEEVLGQTVYQVAIKRLDEIVPNEQNYEPMAGSVYQTKAQLRRAIIEDFSDQALQEFYKLHFEKTHGIDFNVYLQGTGGVAVTAHEVYNTVSENIKSHGYDGIIVIWDEFGFALEQLLKGGQTGVRDLGQEAMDLQNFIEQACRGNHFSRRIIFMGFTHVSLSEYGTRVDLNESDQNRLDTISGRFRDPSIHIRLGVTESEGYHLIAGMINRSQLGHELFTRPIVKLQQIAERLPRFRLWSNLNPEICYNNIITPCYPIHPIATTALLLLSDQIAQLNRTTFYFLQNSDEEGALQHISKTDMPIDNEIGGSELLRIHALFSFFENAIKENKIRLYDQYLEAITLHPDASDLEIKILRTVLVLMVIANPDFSPTTDFLCFCLCDKEANEADAHKIHEALDNLSLASVLWKNDATDVWSFVGGRGVNSEIEKLVEEQKDLIPKAKSADLIRRYPEVQEEITDLLGDFALDPTESGIIRRVSVKLFDISQETNKIEVVNPAKEGLSKAVWRSAIIYLLMVDSESQLTYWRNQLRNVVKSNIYFILPTRPLEINSEIIRELIAVQKSLNQTEPENHAYDVLEGKLTNLRKKVKAEFNSLFGNEGMRTGAEIVKSGESSSIQHFSSWNEFFLSLPKQIEEDLNSKVNVRCGAFNEWYTRSNWGVIKNIVEHIIKFNDHPDWQKQYLGFSETSQDAAIIDGVLIENGFLIQNPLTENWNLIEVDKDCSHDALIEIRKHIRKGGNEGIPFLKLYSKLIDVPYGIPNGIIPILIALVLRTEGSRIGIFKQDGTRGPMRKITSANICSTLVEMAKCPKKFITRYEKLSGKYRNVFKAIGPEIGITEDVDSLGEAFYEFCSNVRRALVRWTSKLPDILPSDFTSEQKKLVKILRNAVPPQINTLAEALVIIIEEDEAAKEEIAQSGLQAYPRTARYWRHFEDQIDRYVDGVKAPFRQAIRDLLGGTTENDSIASEIIKLISTLEIPPGNRIIFERIENTIGQYFPGNDVYGAIVSAICDKNIEQLTEQDYGRALGIIEVVKMLPEKKPTPTTEVRDRFGDQTTTEVTDGLDDGTTTEVTGGLGDRATANVTDGLDGEMTTDHASQRIILILPYGKRIELSAFSNDEVRRGIQVFVRELSKSYSLTNDELASLIINEMYLSKDCKE